ncbi:MULTISPECIES: thioredoxin family protein [unclassified Rummeliibacillus]|uniref:thioredoxin family protein n=1 Tax=unclassified Rummeliibacillus TaxID=2622809 RepID=UPI000E6733F4|nr:MULTISPECIES: thioredoxin family protein [unclassified Rummeliibacillus]RIJ63938.1 thioredoxin [Rummeliibacillus sp. POC4]RPJ95446.1 thioredoxin [Rummeliibacillus sp. TYF005]
MQEWSIEEWENMKESKEQCTFYLYTSMCGTCQVASKMMEIMEATFPDIPMGKANINYVEQLAIDYKIESVPCLLITENGKVRDKIYAFQSVSYLFEKIQKKD